MQELTPSSSAGSHVQISSPFTSQRANKVLVALLLSEIVASKNCGSPSRTNSSSSCDMMIAVGASLNVLNELSEQAKNGKKNIADTKEKDLYTYNLTSTFIGDSIFFECHRDTFVWYFGITVVHNKCQMCQVHLNTIEFDCVFLHRKK